MHKLEPVIRELITAVQPPSYVKETLVEFGEDWTGNPAVWIYVIVSNSKLNTKDGHRQAMDLAGRIEDAIIQAELGVWPFVRFRTQQEQAALVAGTY